MKSALATTLAIALAAACSLAVAPALAANEAVAPVPAASAAAPRLAAPVETDAAVAAGEPAVTHTVIDDGRARIDELRVRGQLQHVTVAPKGLPSYQIITGDGSRDLTEGPTGSRGAAGKRVWNVLRF